MTQEPTFSHTTGSETYSLPVTDVWREELIAAAAELINCEVGGSGGIELEQSRVIAERVLAAVLPLIEEHRQPLFALGDFTMHSGDIGHWKIECDALSDADIACIAFMLSERLPAFGTVYGIPRGGLRLAEAMKHYQTEGLTLIVDDVCTTGSSFEAERGKHASAFGACIFARGPYPSWVTPLFAFPALIEEHERAGWKQVAWIGRADLDEADERVFMWHDSPTEYAPTGWYQVQPVYVRELEPHPDETEQR